MYEKTVGDTAVLPRKMAAGGFCKKKKRNNCCVVPLFILQVVSLILSFFHAVAWLFLGECDNLIHILGHPFL